MMRVMAHEADVNVISWNHATSYMLASGGDDGTLRIWDLRNFKPADFVAHFKWEARCPPCLPSRLPCPADLPEACAVALWLFAKSVVGKGRPAGPMSEIERGTLARVDAHLSLPHAVEANGLLLIAQETHFPRRTAHPSRDLQF